MASKNRTTWGGSICAALSLAAAAAFGLDNVWTGADDGCWENSSNWTAFESGDYWLINDSATSKEINFSTEASHNYNFAVATAGAVFAADDTTCGLRQSASDVRIGTWTYGSLEIVSGYHEFNELAVSSAWWDNTGPIDGLLTINGGSLAVATTTWVGSGQAANNPGSDGVINVESGSLTFGGTATLGCVEGAAGTLNVNGGTVTASAIAAGSGTATLNLDGGTLTATQPGTFIGGGVTLNVGSNGGTIDTCGFNLEIAATVAGRGNITIKGDGTVTFTGDTSAWTGHAANFVLSSGSSLVWLGNGRISGSVFVGGSLKFGAPSDVAGCDIDYDFGTGDFDSSFTNLGGELADSTINSRAAKCSDAFKVQLSSAKGCRSTFGVFRSDATPNYGNIFLSSDTGGKNGACRWLIGRHNNLSNWEKYIYGAWSGTDGLWQNGVAGNPVTSSPVVFSGIGQWTRYSPDMIVLGNGYSMTWGELVLYNREVTEAERVGIEDYLMWKWKFNDSYAPLTSANSLETGPGATLDLGGLAVTVASFSGSGTVKNGTLLTMDNVFTQGDGDLTMPAVDGATYVASSSLCKLTITGGEGKSVTVRIPYDWYKEASVAKGHAIFCEGNVTFEYDDGGWTPEVAPYRLESGWWHLYDTEEDADAEMDAELAARDAELDAETDSSGNPIAFPGARGWGRFAKGARASSSPTVLHVTNLNDSGTGSLRWAVTQSNAIVVFDVSGVIRIKDAITFGSNLYIAGQTAPGEGITVYGNRCSFTGSSNIICRYLRWRMGHVGSKGKDCAGLAHGTNMIFDHCSFSWGRDETFSINPDNKGDLGYITLQNSIIGQGLMTHSAGGLMQADYITLYRNFYCDNKTRNNKLKGRIQYVNNTVYNWKNGCVILGGDSSGQSYCNITGNLFVNGPAGGGDGLGGGNSLFHFYGDDNWQDKNADGEFAPYLVTTRGGGGQVSTPYDYPELPAYPGYRLLDKHLPSVGASLPYRDPVDYYMIDEIMSFGTSGKLITYETALPIGAPTTWSWWNAGETRTDTDGDGMPDDWEDANGLDKYSSSDATGKASNGYLNIENYINSLTAENRQFVLRPPLTPGRGGKTVDSITVTWRDYTEGEDGFEVSYAPYGSSSWTVAGTTAAGATSFTIEGLDSGTYYNIRIRAFAEYGGSTVYSGYSSTVKLYTSASSEAEVDISTFTPDKTYQRVSNSQSWNKSVTSGWVEGTAFVDGDKVLINQNSSGSGIALNVDESVEPGAVVINGTGAITLNGNGNLGGAACSINKGNTGHLFLYGANTYTGPVINHGGTISFNNIGNGGVASSLGASLSFADNWVFDGGTYRFTGGTYSTDRDALLRSSSTLEVKDKVLTMNGIFEGEGDFTLQGGGTLAVPKGSFFGYTGATILKGGTLSLSDANASTGSAMNFHPTQLVMAGGSLFIASDSGYQQEQDMELDIEVANNSTSSITIPGRGSFGGTVSNASDEEDEDDDGADNDDEEYVYTGDEGALRIYVPYSRGYVATDFSQFHGTIIANCTHKDARFLKNGSWNAPTVRFYLERSSVSGATTYMSAYPANTTNKLGGLSGDEGTYLIGCSSGTSSTPCNWIVGYANTDETFNGEINNLTWDLKHSANVSITKVGTGYWRLNGNTEHRSGTTVSAGTLIMNGSNTGAGAVTVESGGTLRGMGSISSEIIVNSGGVLYPGDETFAPTNSGFVLSGGVTLESGARLKFKLGRDDDGNLGVQYRMRPSGTFSIASGAILSFDMTDAGTLEAGNSFSIMSLVPTFTGSFDTIEPAVPGKGLKWDLSDLASGGKAVKVVADPDYVAVLDPTDGASEVVVNAATEDEAYEALSVEFPDGVSEDIVAKDDYKAYFSYRYANNGDGTFTVSIAGFDDAVEGDAMQSALNALGAVPDGDGNVSVDVKPGLFYGFSTGTELEGLSAPERELATGTSRKVKKPVGGDSGFIRIDIDVQ